MFLMIKNTRMMLLAHTLGSEDLESDSDDCLEQSADLEPSCEQSRKDVLNNEERSSMHGLCTTHNFFIG